MSEGHPQEAGRGCSGKEPMGLDGPIKLEIKWKRLVLFSKGHPHDFFPFSFSLYNSLIFNVGNWFTSSHINVVSSVTETSGLIGRTWLE